MTEVGHALTGAAIGVLSMPEIATTRRKFFHTTAFILIASIPDLPFINWGHDRYYFSHSLFVNLFLIFLMTAILMPAGKLRMLIGGWPVIIGGSCALISHLLLDSFYNHGKGIAIYWPVSKARLALPIPWFDLGIGSPCHMMQVFTIEFISYFPLLLLALLIRRKWSASKSIP